MDIPSEVNLVPFSKIGETDRGSYARILALIVALRCLFSCDILVHSCTPELNDSDLYVATFSRKRGVVGIFLSRFGKGGR